MKLRNTAIALLQKTEQQNKHFEPCDGRHAGEKGCEISYNIMKLRNTKLPFPQNNKRKAVTKYYEIKKYKSPITKQTFLPCDGTKLPFSTNKTNISSMLWSSRRERL